MHLLILIAALLGEEMCVRGQAPTPSAVRFIGVGYNLVKGNPEGGALHNGGIDPGLLPTRKILLLSYDEGRVTADRRFELPDEVNFSPRISCVKQTATSMFAGGKSYQREMMTSVTASSNILGELAFTASAAFRKVERTSQTSGVHKVYYQSTKVCNMGRARYRDELATAFSITEGFAAGACSLPTAYDKNVYMNFLDDWGTHLVVEVDVGSKAVERYEESETEIIKYALDHVKSSVSIGGSFLGFSGSASVDIETFNRNRNAQKKFGSFKYSFKIGGDKLHEPIHIEIIPMTDVFESKYWTSLPDFVEKNLCSGNFSLQQVKQNIQTALKGYAAWKNLRPPSEPRLRIPFTWPKGTYGFPSATSGCPRNVWSTGSRFHDTEDKRTNNQWSSNLHLRGEFNDNIRHYFCMKTVAEEDKYKWSFPRGKYCVYKKGQCPAGLRQGMIHWDDEDSRNKNSAEGTLPDGNYNSNTDIYFCCRTDGYAAQPIYLPTDKPFILLANDKRCQAVHGMNVRREFVRWDTEDRNNKDRSEGSAPTIGPGWLRLSFCYYYK